jgi:hypothetical protein
MVFCRFEKLLGVFEISVSKSDFDRLKRDVEDMKKDIKSIKVIIKEIGNQLEKPDKWKISKIKGFR